MDRRSLLQGAGAAAVGLAIAPFGRALADDSMTLPFASGERPLVRYPGKRALLRLTARPPQLETPFSVFDEAILTPNDAFFVRYHLADIPLSIDTRHPEAGWRADRDRGREPMLRQLARLRRATRRRWATRQRRHGQRALDRGPSQGRAG